MNYIIPCNGFRIYMSKNTILFYTFLLIGLSKQLQAQKSIYKVSKPNIIILFTDDQGYGDVGCYGSKVIPTPNLDKMASEGMRFTNFYAAAASCTPSRASLLTGNYALRIGLPDVVDDLSNKGLSSAEFTIADYLKQNGYETGMFGKWHLGHHAEFMPNRHGFKEYFGIPYSADMWPFHPKPGHNYPQLPLYHNESVVEYNPDVNQMTNLFTNKAIEFIKTNKDKPFFVYLPYSQPHVPLGASDQFKGKSDAGLYGDAVMEIDWSVGEINNTLDKLGISENTLVLFSSDNGPWLSYGNHGGSTGGLREGKGTVFGGGQKVPFLARMPGSIPAGVVEKQVITALDVMPTVLNITNTKMPRMQPIDGQNIWPLLSQKGKVDNMPFFFIYSDEVQAVREGKWKLHIPHQYRIVKEEGKDGIPGVQLKNGGSIELSLFDLEKDPSESKNLAEKYPKKVKHLKSLIETFNLDLKKNSRPAGIVEK